MKLRNKLLIGVLMAPTMSFGAVMGSSPTVSGYDRVQSSSGVSCESSLGSDTQLQIGVYGSKNGRNNDQNYISHSYENSRVSDDAQEYGVYAQVVIPLTGAKKRLDCNKLYELELAARKLEIDKLKEELRLMEMDASAATVFNEN